MAGQGEWCTIESDPGVFTEMIRGFGTKGAQVEELWGLDEGLFKEIKPIHGLIFLFKWVEEKQDNSKVITGVRADEIYFAKQIITNACATQALVNLLLNCNHKDIDLGPNLTSFKEFTLNFDPVLRGTCLNNADVIRSVHNSFARNEIFESLDRKAEKDDDVFHFVGYLPINGSLVELDGLAEGPIDHGKIPDGEEWTKTATPIIEERMQRYMGNEIRFTLLALVSDRKMTLSRQIEQLQRSYDDMPSEGTLDEINRLRELVEQEKEKDRLHKVENARRKHNFLPFLIELFKILAETGKLGAVYEEAARKGQERETRNKKLRTDKS